MQEAYEDILYLIQRSGRTTIFWVTETQERAIRITGWLEDELLVRRMDLESGHPEVVFEISNEMKGWVEEAVA